MFPNIDEAIFRQRFSEDINPLMICVYKFYVKKHPFEYNHEWNGTLSKYA